MDKLISLYYYYVFLTGPIYEINQAIKKFVDFTDKRKFICKICQDGKEMKGTLYNFKCHIARTHKEIADRLGFTTVYKERPHLNECGIVYNKIKKK